VRTVVAKRAVLEFNVYRAATELSLHVVHEDLESDVLIVWHESSILSLGGDGIDVRLLKRVQLRPY